MKLIFCPECQDIVRLTENLRYCGCGESWGLYKPDGLNALIGGKSVPLGIDNASFIRALRNRPKEGLGSRFESFVIPAQCGTIIEAP